MPWLWVNTEYSRHRVQHTPSTAYTEYSIHWVQHTPSTASTHDCLSSLHSHNYELTPECSFSFWCASFQDRPPLAGSPWELKGKASLLHSHGCELTNWWIESQHPACLLSISFKYPFNLAQSWPPSASPNSFDHGLQVHLQTRSITGSKQISEFTRSWPPSVSPNLTDHGLQVRTMMASKCISKLPRSGPPSASPNSLDHGLQVHL